MEENNIFAQLLDYMVFGVKKYVLFVISMMIGIALMAMPTKKSSLSRTAQI